MILAGCVRILASPLFQSLPSCRQTSQDPRPSFMVSALLCYQDSLTGLRGRLMEAEIQSLCNLCNNLQQQKEKKLQCSVKIHMEYVYML